MRAKYNAMVESSIEKSALFMVINKTCFRGMYREGPNGYNVPYGHYKKTPTVITKEELDNISKLIKNVVFTHAGFSQTLKTVTIGDFVYLDPPYAPENNTSFVKYIADGFTYDMHKELFSSIKDLVIKKDVLFVMSNSNVELVTKNFQDFSREEIIARRAINSKNPESTAREVLIYN
jgi:DNA adenine methylase